MSQTVQSSHIEPIVSNIKFSDIAGIESIKEELEEIVDFLNNPKKYTLFGVTLPKGVLLVGPQELGKHLLQELLQVKLMYHFLPKWGEFCPYLCRDGSC